MYRFANPCTTRSTLNSCTTPCQTVNSCIVRAMPSHAQSPGPRSCRHAHSRSHFLPIHLNCKTSCHHPMLRQHTMLRSPAVTPRGAHILWLAFVHGVPLSINILLRPRLASTLDLWKDTALTAAPTRSQLCPPRVIEVTRGTALSSTRCPIKDYHRSSSWEPWSCSTLHDTP